MNSLPIEKAPGRQSGGLGNDSCKQKYSAQSTATEAQIKKLLELLALRPHHTHELRMAGISHPAGRIRDLVKRGYQITTALISTIDSDGYPHKGVALYTLVAEPSNG